ncbi:hypothetical protein WJX82_007011 [Trebouxia sp. C0006]
MDILPHRFPFLLVDRVIELEPEKYAVGYKNVTINDNFFPGHFPQRAIMPGVLQVEAMAQLGGLLMIDPENEAAKNNFFFGGVDNCKWRRPVVPGDCLMMRVELIKFNKRYGFAKMRGTCHVGANLAVSTSCGNSILARSGKYWPRVTARTTTSTVLLRHALRPKTYNLRAAKGWRQMRDKLCHLSLSMQEYAVF